MLLIAGLSLGLWVVLPELRNWEGPAGRLDPSVALAALTFLLGGLSLVGLPLLLLERRRDRQRWGAGKLLWFATGSASWLLWPPIVVRRARGGDMGDVSSGVCFAYGTPLMAVYVTLALLASGWLGRRGRRRMRRSWREVFGLLLGLAWACTGLYVLYLIYSEDL
jgi:hypothetical protein